MKYIYRTKYFIGSLNLIIEIVSLKIVEGDIFVRLINFFSGKQNGNKIYFYFFYFEFL